MTKKPTRKLTKSQALKLYKTECEWWIDKLELNEWDRTYECSDTGDNYGQIYANSSSMKALFKIDCKYKFSSEEVFNTAYHECIELLLIVLSIYVSKRSIDEDAVDGETHRIIHKLRPILMSIREKDRKEEPRCLKKRKSAK